MTGEQNSTQPERESEVVLCPDCGHPDDDCICWLGEWCPICQEFECCEDTHG